VHDKNKYEKLYVHAARKWSVLRNTKKRITYINSNIEAGI
jgi:hypothetical protein